MPFVLVPLNCFVHFGHLVHSKHPGQLDAVVTRATSAGSREASSFWSLELIPELVPLSTYSQHASATTHQPTSHTRRNESLLTGAVLPISWVDSLMMARCALELSRAFFICVLQSVDCVCAAGHLCGGTLCSFFKPCDGCQAWGVGGPVGQWSQCRAFLHASTND